MTNVMSEDYGPCSAMNKTGSACKMRAVTDRRLCIVHDPAFAELKAITDAVESQRRLLRDLAAEEAKLAEFQRLNKREQAFHSELSTANLRLQQAVNSARAEFHKLDQQIKKAAPAAQAATVLERALALFNGETIPVDEVMAGVELARAIRLQAKWSDEEAEEAARRKRKDPFHGLV